MSPAAMATKDAKWCPEPNAAAFTEHWHPALTPRPATALPRLLPLPERPLPGPLTPQIDPHGTSREHGPHTRGHPDRRSPAAPLRPRRYLRDLEHRIRMRTCPAHALREFSFYARRRASM